MSSSSHQVCIVDDDLSVRRALGRLVRAFGFDVEIFSSGKHCLDEFHSESAACMIIDVTMPGLDGFELYDLLTTAGRSVPTIFISAHDTAEYIDRAHSTGCVAFLSKPCDEGSLLKALNKAIAGNL